MTEKLNQNTDKKSFLEKRIHEQAIEQFYQEIFQALSSLSNSILGKMNVKNVSGYDYYDSLAQELTEQLLYHLQNIYGLDTDYWQDDLEGMLDDAFDY